MAGSKYIKLPKKIGYSKKGLVNVPNVDGNECFKWCLARYLNTEDHYPARIIKKFSEKLDFKDVKYIVKIRDIHKVL